MAGYHGFSESNNALAAKENDVVPASYIKQVPAKLIKDFLPRDEWHHSSKFYNKVNFYSRSRVLAVFGLIQSDEYDADPRAIKALADFKKTKKSPVELNDCRVKWLEWYGSKKRPKCREKEAAHCTLKLKGQTATVTLPNGQELIKRFSTNGFYVYDSTGKELWLETLV